MPSTREEHEQDDIPPGERPCSSVKMKSISSFFKPKVCKPNTDTKPKQQNPNVDIQTKTEKAPAKPTINGKRHKPISLDDSMDETESSKNSKEDRSKPKIEMNGDSKETLTDQKEIPSKTVTKPVTEVSYQDFLKGKTSAPKAEVKEMSYEEFLKGQASKQKPVEDKEKSVQVQEKGSEKLEGSQDKESDEMQAKPKGCVSISNFFAKVDKASIKPEVKKPLVVQAIIHTSSPGVVKTPSMLDQASGKKKTKKKHKGKSNVVIDLDMSIISLDDGDENTNNNKEAVSSKPTDKGKESDKKTSSEESVSKGTKEDISNEVKEETDQEKTEKELKDTEKTKLPSNETKYDENHEVDCEIVVKDRKALSTKSKNQDQTVVQAKVLEKQGDKTDSIELVAENCLPEETEIVDIEDDSNSGMNAHAEKKKTCQNSGPAKTFSIFSKPEKVKTVDLSQEKTVIEVADDDKPVVSKDVNEKPKPAKTFSIFSKPSKKDVRKPEESEIEEVDGDDSVQITSEVSGNRLSMGALDSVKTDPTKKTSQSTLSFGKKGMEVKKVAKSDGKESSKKPEENVEVEKKLKAKGTPKSGKKTKVVEEKEEVSAKTNRKSKRRPSVTEEEAEDVIVDDDIDETKDNTEKKKLKKTPAIKKASVSKAAQLVARARGRPASKKAAVSPGTRAPKPKRPRRLSSSEEEEEEEEEEESREGPKKKEKYGEVPKKEEPVGEEGPVDDTPRRSSSRLARAAAKAAAEAITLKAIFDEGAESPERESKRKGKKTDGETVKKEEKAEKKTDAEKEKKGKLCLGKAPVTPKKKKNLAEKVQKEKAKNSPQRDTGKKAPKLAPLFCKGKKPSPEDVVIIEDTEEERIMSAERRSFLMSGVPEEMRRQRAVIEAAAAAATEASAPWPRYLNNHVRQWEGWSESESWENAGEMKLKLREEEEEEVVDAKSVWMKTERSIKREIKLTSQKDRATISEDTVKLLLAEIATHSQSFPVRRVYRQLRQHHQQQATTAGPANIQAPNNQPTTTTTNNNPPPTDTKTPSARKRRRGKQQSPEEDWSVVVSVSDSEGEEPPAKKPSLRLSLRRSSRAEMEKKMEKKTEKMEKESNGKLGEDPTKTVTDVGKEEKPQNSTDDKCKRWEDEAWTDKYSPRCSGEVLGNTRVVERLRGWLQDWKEHTCREIRRIQQQQQQEEQKKGDKKAKQEWWDSDDSDFAVGSEEEDSRGGWEDGLGNTMLLTGPTGVGKTAAVYALAQQLGYKVFEVNASSRRSGKQVVTDLQEATQSHQVRHNGGPSTPTITMPGVPVTKPVSKPAPAKKLPTAFAGFFKKSATTPTPSSPATPPKGKRKSEAKSRTPAKSPRAKSPKAKRARKKSADEDIAITGVTESPQKKGRGRPKGKAATPSLPQAMEAKKKGLDLSSVSLILFEEVDIVLEEDRAFWAAIQTFMHTTKRPIILTTSDPGFLRRFGPRAELRLETLVFRTPPMTHVAAYLQLVSLAEGFRTSAEDISALVRTFRGDIRRCLLSLQLWLRSGASHTPHPDPIRYRKSALASKQTPGDEGFASQPLDENSQNASDGLVKLQTKNSEDDEFQSLRKPRTRELKLSQDPDSSDFDSPIKSRGRKKRVLIEDESSQESGVPPTSQSAVAGDWSQESQGSVSEACKEEEEETVALVDREPAVQKGFFMMTAAGESQDKGLLEILDQGELSTAVSTLSSLHHLPACRLVYTNLLHLLHLPTEIRAPATYTRLSAPSVPKLTRIKNNDDLFDSEGDSDVDIADEKPGENGEVDVESTPQKVQKSTARKKSGVLTKDDKLLGETIDNLAELYDAISYTDCQFHRASDIGSWCRQNFEIGLGSVGAGQLNEFGIGEERDEGLCVETAEWVLMGNVRRCRRVVERAMGEGSKEVKDALTVPVGGSVDRLLVQEETDTQRRARASYHQAAVSVLDALNPPRLSTVRRRGDQALDSFFPSSSSSTPAPAAVNKWAVVQDYLPVLRTLCKGEQVRQAAKTKRRFLHYLDHIHLNLKQSTLDTLCSSFS